MKMNSLEDKEMIDEFYKASKAGVPIRFIVRGICCLRPGRAGLSDNIEVRSIVGDYLEHARIFYFHQAGKPKLYAGSADMMVRSFERRLEALFLIANPQLKREAINILYYNLQDNQNTYVMREDGAYVRRTPVEGEAISDLHKEFYSRNLVVMPEEALYDDWLSVANIRASSKDANGQPKEAVVVITPEMLPPVPGEVEVELEHPQREIPMSAGSGYDAQEEADLA